MNIAWIKKDLRLEDNPVLAAAAQTGDPTVIVYIKDPRDHSKSPQGWDRTGTHRAAFEHACVTDLAESLTEKGAGLLILEGTPEELIFELAKEIGATKIFHSQESGIWERERARRTLVKLLTIGCRGHICRANTMLEPIDLNSVGTVFTPFSRVLNATNPTGPQNPEPTVIPIFREIWRAKTETSLDAWKKIQPIAPNDPRSSLRTILIPGEHGGQAHRKNYLETHAKSYHFTRNGLHGTDYSSKLSPWLAHGCISARTTGKMVKEAVAQKTLPWEAAKKLMDELTWRDFFWHIALKHRSKIFRPEGIDTKSPRLPQRDVAKLNKWTQGNTSDPLVNAFMRELAATGYMSNRGRQIVASYLIHDLNQPWVDGAWWFQSQLVDFDPAQNWGNWLHASGNGTDPVPDRRFNTRSQAEKFDADGSFRKLWGK